MGIIYKITNPNDRIYVGKTVNFKRRMADYRRSNIGGSSIIIRSIKKYGWVAHKFEIIEEVENEKLNEREIFWIKELKSCAFDGEDNLNLTYGGDGPSWLHDKGRRDKQANRFTGAGNPFYGRHHTDEFKKKKSKEVSDYNKRVGCRIPEWGAEKGRDIVRKAVVAYDSGGMFIGEYKSLTIAATSIAIKLQGVKDSLLYKQWVSGKYMFHYKTESYPMQIEVGEIGVKNVRRPVLTLDEDYNIVCEHPSAQEASDFWGIPKTTINRAAQYNWLKPIRTGHVFLYKDLHDVAFSEAA